VTEESRFDSREKVFPEASRPALVAHPASYSVDTGGKAGHSPSSTSEVKYTCSHTSSAIYVCLCGENRHIFALLYTRVSGRRREDQNFRWDGKPDPPRTVSLPIRNPVRNSSLTEKCTLLDTLDRLDDQATSQQEDIVRTASVLAASIWS
jgi:hypothetical protein